MKFENRKTAIYVVTMINGHDLIEFNLCYIFLYFVEKQY